MTRALIGFLLASLVSGWAYQRAAMTRGGALAAMLVGMLAAAAGWPWCVVLLTFFFTALLAERLVRGRQSNSSLAIAAKLGARDAVQVVANGGPFACCALLALWSTSPIWWIAGVSSLSAAAADTFGTTFGQALGGAPRSLRGWQTVPTGTSGAVTLAGLAASGLGAALVTLAAGPTTRSVPLSLIIFASGVIGALVDSLLGATIQERRWCPRCGLETEQRVHRCGVGTERVAGTWLNNDGVNLTSVIIAAVLGALGWRMVA